MISTHEKPNATVKLDGLVGGGRKKVRHSGIVLINMLIKIRK